MSSSNVTLGNQILAVLCKGGSSFNGLLSALQSRYPSSGWTSALLTTQTNLAVRQGRLMRATNGVGFIVNPRMLNNNYATNLAYSTTCAVNPTPCDCSHSCAPH